MHFMWKENRPMPRGWKAAGAFACALMLVTLFVCDLSPSGVAFADEVAYGEGGEGERDLVISADVASPPVQVIKVEVPSSSSAVDIRIRTSVLNGRFLGFAAAKSTVRNLPESTVPISAEVVEVTDGAGGRQSVLGYLGVTLVADRAVELVEGANRSDVLIDHLAPGSTAELSVDVYDKSSGSPIPDGQYGMSATIKIAAV